MSFGFLSDWTFWSALVALVALLLSQLPPVKSWFEGARLDLELYSRIHLSHKVGNPNVQLHLILENTGGRRVRVKSMQLDIERDGKKVASLDAPNYLLEPQDNQTLLLTPFTLYPEEEWSHSVNFLNYFNREEEKKYRSAEKSLKDFVRKTNKGGDNAEIVRADENLVKPFMDIFESKFIWGAGEYKIKVLIETESQKTDTCKTFRFTLFESQSEELAAVKKGYSAGDGIFWDSGNHLGLVTQIEEVNG